VQRNEYRRLRGARSDVGHIPDPLELHREPMAQEFLKSAPQ
jgi:hypothetical protein